MQRITSSCVVRSFSVAMCECHMPIAVGSPVRFPQLATRLNEGFNNTSVEYETPNPPQVFQSCLRYRKGRRNRRGHCHCFLSRWKSNDHRSWPCRIGVDHRPSSQLETKTSNTVKYSSDKCDFRIGHCTSCMYVYVYVYAYLVRCIIANSSKECNNSNSKHTSVV